MTTHHTHCMNSAVHKSRFMTAVLCVLFVRGSRISKSLSTVLGRGKPVLSPQLCVGLIAFLCVFPCRSPPGLTAVCYIGLFLQKPFPLTAKFPQHTNTLVNHSCQAFWTSCLPFIAFVAHFHGPRLTAPCPAS